MELTGDFPEATGQTPRMGRGGQQGDGRPAPQQQQQQQQQNGC